MYYKMWNAEAFPLAAVAYIVRLELVSDGGKKNISGVSLSGQKHHHTPPKETNCSSKRI